MKALINFLGKIIGWKETAEDRRIKKDRSKNHYTPPRSMTPAEKDYYALNKNLNGFYNQ